MRAKQTRKKARKPRSSGAKTPRIPEFTSDDMIALDRQQTLLKRSETAWQQMIASPEGDDRWSDLEEHMLNKNQQEAHASRRWKYFSK
ncbi:MAG: hypothetical protein KGO96_00545 [Elusimicrobia bacterium]|nr:hypothetical protein [Elusimicrobiota bacterium]MDE2424382.1 hypothetical protein [Elusimicrobiota bacterium]